MGLSKARASANGALAKIAAGEDPAGTKRAARAAGKAGELTTVADLIESYIAAGEKGRHWPNARPKRPGTLVIERHYFEKNIRPRFGNLGVNDLARSQVQLFLDELCDRSLAVALQSHQVLSQAFNYGIRNEVVKANPAQFVALPAAPQRERVLTDAELREIWNGVEETIGVIITDPAIGLAIRLAMLTLQRGGEVAGIHVREIDQGSRSGPTLCR